MRDVEDAEKDLQKRINSMRKLLDRTHSMKEFNRQVFESIVDYVVVGGYDEQGNADPCRITFVYKTGFEDAKNGINFKPRRMNAASEKLQSSSTGEDEKLLPPSGSIACGDGSLDVTRQQGVMRRPGIICRERLLAKAHLCNGLYTANAADKRRKPASAAHPAWRKIR